jgi:hypothetical protein
MTDPTNYPEWFYYPSRTRPPDWVHALVAGTVLPGVLVGAWLRRLVCRLAQCLFAVLVSGSSSRGAWGRSNAG